MRTALLETAGFVPVLYRESLQVVVEEAIASWKDFSKLPLGEKRKFSLDEQKDVGKDVGYVLRVSEGKATYDDKEFFHATNSTPKELRAAMKGVQGVYGDRVMAFLDATDALVKETTPLVREFARSVERDWHLKGFEDEVMEGRNDWTFRYLHYFPSEKGDSIAKPHIDRGGFTLHMYESHPGGEFLNISDKKWRPLPINESETVIFPSIMLQRRSGSRLKALCHRVVATPEAAKEGRYAMVVFINFKSTHRFDDVHHRLQDMEPGFNYTIAPADFNDLFVLR